MRIISIRDQVVPIRSSLRNAYIDFSQMTVSAVAIVTDVVKEGRPVVGYGFDLPVEFCNIKQWCLWILIRFWNKCQIDW